MFNSNRKKIRGWKRRIRHIDAWFERNKAPDTEHFKNRGEDYIKIWIDPWNRLHERTPPNWYFRLIIHKIILIHALWQRHYESLNIPFDLQIWLNDPHTVRSQIVCAKVDAAGDAREYYRKSRDIKKFPPAKWYSESYHLDAFVWQLFDDEYLHFKEAEELDDEDVADLLRNGFKAEKTKVRNHDDIMYSKKAGNVWIGRLK